ncbi:MAG TPA: SigE family RNA polymerase sigma factor [Micromonosporaceae bacterium]|nr:SigE family RNA polymerase sigma factor [Micromonosporaceae bacterium]HCU49433.1 SigE family RNA polymerase sigma factor [Micromonosporaceae bacterium]
MGNAEARAAFEDFVVARWAALTRIAYLMTGNRHDAEDLWQTALARVATKWAKIDDHEAYVRRVLYTQAVSHWRWLRRRPPEVLTDQLPNVSAQETDRETRIVLDQALRRLTPKQRAVLVLRFYEDRSESQTAELLECSVGTKMVHARRQGRRCGLVVAASSPDRTHRHPRVSGEGNV